MPAEPRIQRARWSVPPSGLSLPGTPLEMPNPNTNPDVDLDATPDANEVSRLKRPRFRRPRLDETGQNEQAGNGAGRHRWRPSSSIGRIFAVLAVLLILGGLAASGFFLKNFLGSDAHFRIDGASNIDAAGLTEVSRAEMLPIFGEDIGRNIFFVPLDERRKQLEEIPWVERATVMRLLPNRIRIQVVERQPVAFLRQGNEIGLVDASGVLLTMPAAMMAQRHYSFPVVTGIKAEDSLVARKARMDIYHHLLAELDANGQHTSAQISEIDLSDPEDARVLMPEQGSDILAHFGEDHFMERYQRYKAHIAEWRQQYPKLAAVDLRYEQQVVLVMNSGTGDPQAPAAASAQANASETKPTDAQAPVTGQVASESPEKHSSEAKPATEKARSVAKAAVSSTGPHARKAVEEKATGHHALAGHSGTAAKAKLEHTLAKPDAKEAAKLKNVKAWTSTASEDEAPKSAKAPRVDTAKNKTVAANKAVAVKDKTERNKGIAVKTEENKAAKNNKAIKESSKRVEAQSATPNAGKRKPVPSVHSAAVAAGGE